MAVYAYKAIELVSGGAPGGGASAVLTGTVIADTPRQARDTLRDRGLTIQEVKEERPAHERVSLTGRLLARRHRGHLPEFIRELGTLLGVGVPLLEALDTVARQYAPGSGRASGGGFRGVILRLRDRVAGGSSLAEAMRQEPVVFDEMCVHLVEVGEDAGNLDQALEQLATYRERAQQLRGRVASALLYPAIVTATGIGVTLFLMSFVVPSLLESLVEADRPLPWPTKVVKGVSDLLVHRWWLLLAGAALAVAALAGAFTSAWGRRIWSRAQLRVPVLGALVRKQAIVRIAVVVATLMRSGIVFLRALEVAERSVKNAVIREALGRCRVAVGAGADIAQALEETKVFPPTVVQVFAVGQQSGRLEDMLDQLAENYDRQVATLAGRLTALLEPVLILVLAAVVGFIAFATILPILEAGHVL